MSLNDSTLSLTRQTTPRTVRDLGSDYTRYFSPFSASNNGSRDELGMPLPRYNSSTHLMGGALSSTDLNKRLSDPFRDTKRVDNPFASGLNTAPGTPGRDIEKMAAGAAIGAAPYGSSTGTGTPNFIREADPEKGAFFPYMDDRLSAPEYAFPLFADQPEDDDDLHMPMWDDDVRLKPKFKDHFTRENLSSTLGLAFMVIGLLTLFIALPVITSTGINLLSYSYETPLDQMLGAFQQAEPWATVNNETYPLMENIRTGLIDPDTPQNVKTKTGINGDDYVLVFSDEFNKKNRTFYPGDDPYWFAPDIWYGGTQDMEWYDPDAVNTGKLSSSKYIDS